MLSAATLRGCVLQAEKPLNLRQQGMWALVSASIHLIIDFKIYILFIYLAAPRLRRSMWALSCGMRDLVP